MAEHKDATEGKYYRWSERIANYLTIELAFLLAIIPSMIGLFFLVDTIDNILLYAVFFVFMGPAFGAMVASIESLGSGENTGFFFTYWRKYRQNFKESFLLSLCFSLIVVICIVDFLYFTGSNLHFLRWFFLALLLFATIVYEYSLLIAMKFHFRFRDLFRLSMVYLFTDLITTLKLMSYTILLLAFSLYVSTAAAPFVMVFFAYFIVKDTQLIIKEVREKYVACDE